MRQGCAMGGPRGSLDEIAKVSDSPAACTAIDAHAPSAEPVTR